MKRVVFLIGIILFLFHPMTVTAQEITGEINRKAEEVLREQFEFEKLDEFLEELYPDRKISFESLIKLLMEGKIKEAAEGFFKGIKELFFYQFERQRISLIQILIITLTASVFANFAGVFKNRQIADISFYMLYLLLIIICLKAFGGVLETTKERLSFLLLFMKVLGPVYLTAVGIAKGLNSALAFYSLVLFLIYLVELLVLHILIPCIHVWMMIKILNFLSPEDYLSRFAELLETLIRWALKTMLAGVIGLNVIQGLLAPALDNVKRTAITRTVEAIPGLGNIAGGAGAVLAGTAALIKNGIGMGGAIVCLIIFLLPLLEAAIYAFTYKLAAAIVQPISDRRVTGCIGSIGKGCEMVMQVIFTTGLLFLITIAVIAATTS
ncbi:MAG: stage III sporulation protein AE [Lachnospiraceae bacterium]|nr:stage III sporulation protein AE [Lachnospiraceae bacterium]